MCNGTTQRFSIRVLAGLPATVCRTYLRRMYLCEHTAPRLLGFSFYSDTQVQVRKSLSGNKCIRKSVFHCSRIVLAVSVGYVRIRDRSRACIPIPVLTVFFRPNLLERKTALRRFRRSCAICPNLIPLVAFINRYSNFRNTDERIRLRSVTLSHSTSCFVRRRAKF